MNSLYIDGDVFAAADGGLDPLRLRQERRLGRQGARGHAPATGPGLLDGGRRARRRNDATGWIYAYDKPNERIVAIDKTDGTYKGQYRLAGGVDGWDDMRSFYVVPGVDEAPSQLVWISPRRVASIEPGSRPGRRAAAPGSPGASPGASGSPAASAKPSAAP